LESQKPTETGESRSIVLSEAQAEAVVTRGTHLQIIACAGSGKTEAVARRIASIIEEGLDPTSIIAFTFTEKAAFELKERVYDRVSDVMGAGFLGRLGPMYVGTIHGFCLRVLQDFVPRFGNFDVLDEHRHAAFIAMHKAEIGLEALADRTWDQVDLFNRAVDAVSNELIPLQSLADTPFAACYSRYLSLLDDYRCLTFSQIVSKAVNVLQEEPAVFASVHGSLKHLIVDEYQDVNPSQERLIELLSASPTELTVVGDDEQAIYQWRGSDVENILTFSNRYPNAHTVCLMENRRSRHGIVDAASSFALTIPNRLEKSMEPVREHGPAEVVCWRSETPETEAAAIADQISKLHEQGWRYQDIAVLFRSVKTSAPPLIDELRNRNIPYDCGGRTGLFTRPEISAFAEVFCWMSGGRWRDARYDQLRDASLTLAVPELARTFGYANSNDLLEYFQDWKRFHSAGSARVSLVGDLYRHLEVLGIDRIDPDDPAGSAMMGALARFSRVLADYEHVTIRGRWTVGESGKRTFKGGMDRGAWFWRCLADYLLNYAMSAYEDFDGELIASLDVVSILTVHQAKGLEWPIVLLPALSTLRFPSGMTGRSQKWILTEEAFPFDKRKRYEGTDEDERRLFYVAMTRARDALYASTFSRITKPQKASPYLLHLSNQLGLSDLLGDEDIPLPDPPDKLKAPVTPPIELGFSDLADFDECGYRYRLSRVFDFQRELAIELGYGRAIHHVLRNIAEEARATQTIPTRDEADAAVQKELYVPFANPASIQNMEKSVLRLVRKYLSDWPDDLFRVWATERPFEVHFDNGILKGRADVILDRHGGRIENLAIVDYKTSTSADRDERYEQQLRVYAAAARQEGLQVGACFLHDLSSSGRRGVNADEGETSDAVEWARNRFGLIASGTFAPKPSKDGCSACDFHKVCRHRHSGSWV
jgi:DNA helicase-2/ATP-dependent DNA helicase PcrA